MHDSVQLQLLKKYLITIFFRFPLQPLKFMTSPQRSFTQKKKLYKVVTSRLCLFCQPRACLQWSRSSLIPATRDRAIKKFVGLFLSVTESKKIKNCKDQRSSGYQDAYERIIKLSFDYHFQLE